MTGKGWKKNIEDKEARRFVGRVLELVLFQQEIAQTEISIFYITGQGGVGKTTLLNRYRAIAKQRGFLLADWDCGDAGRDVPTILGHFAEQLEQQQAHLKRFDERYKVYRQKMHEIESDPEAPQGGLAAFSARMLTRAAYIAGDAIPGVRQGLKYLPQDTAETQASEWASFLAKKMSNKDDIALLKEPDPILSALFFEDLNQVAEKKSILLCFENFEAARQELRDWLLSLPEYDPSENIRIAIAGRDKPLAHWEPLQAVTEFIDLDIFSEQEADKFLDTYNITDPKRRTEIIHWSGRLPVLMSWLASTHGSDPNPAVPTHDIVERFLRWVSEPAWRSLALLAAIPRTFNVDILKVLLDHKSQPPDRQTTFDKQTTFDWLQSMPFVQTSSEGWQYHPIVRTMMLHYQRQKSPDTYRQLHETLANFYNAKRSQHIFEKDEEWANEQWQKQTLAYLYHLLAADATRHWAEVISLFVVALRKRRAFATDISELLHSNELRDELNAQQQADAQLFYEQLQAIKAGDLHGGLKMFERLCSMSNLSAAATGYALAYQAECYRADRQWEKAIADFTRALDILPEDTWALAYRGRTYHRMEHYEEALANYNQAIAFDEKDSWTIKLRGETYRMQRRDEEAFADFSRAITLNEKDAWAIASRGEIYRRMKKYEQALTDLDRAISLNEKYPWAFAERGETYRQMKRYQEALIDFNRAISLNEKYHWAVAHRGRTYFALGKYEEALIDFNRAIALNEKDSRSITKRGEIYRQMERYQEALADFNRAIALNEKDDWVIAQRGRTYHRMGRYQEALADYNQAIAFNEKNIWAREVRGETYHMMGRYQEALADFDHAIALNEKDVWALARRGETYRSLGKYEEALADFNRAIALNEQSDWYKYDRAQIYYLTHQIDAFQDDINAILKPTLSTAPISPDDWQHAFNQALYHLLAMKEDDARSQYDQLIPTCPFIAKLQETAEDLTDLLQVQPENVLARQIRAQVQQRISDLRQDGEK